MPADLNRYQQPVGAPLPNWTIRPQPEKKIFEGRLCRLEPLDATRHAADLYAAYSDAPDRRDWTYLKIEPFTDESSYRSYVEAAAHSTDTLHFAVIDLKSARATGTLALMHIDTANGSIEVGNVVFSPRLKRSAISTEAHYLLMKYVFNELGYRRYEWTCNSLNQASRCAAARLGFQFEGVLRQALVCKGRNRDNAWFSMSDGEWPDARMALEKWLAPENFDDAGLQIYALQQLRQNAHKPDCSALGTRVSAVRPLNPEEFALWLPLWIAYQEFYKVKLADSLNTQTWQRLMDPLEPMYVLGAFDEQQQLLGIAHFIYHRSTWTSGDYCYLQDLFSVPQARGVGAGRSLIEAIIEKARNAGASRVYWLTHESNTTARLLYDRIADNAGFIQYRKNLV